MLGAWVASTVILVDSCGDSHISGQLRGDKECPFSGVTKSGRVWRKVPESDARSVGLCRKLRYLHGRLLHFINSTEIEIKHQLKLCTVLTGLLQFVTSSSTAVGLDHTSLLLFLLSPAAAKQL